jgi:hypothetical protein
MSIIFDIPKKIFSIEFKNKYKNSSTIIFCLYNKKYTNIKNIFYDNDTVAFYYEYIIHNDNNNLSFKFFDNIYYSGLYIKKNNEKKEREFI